MAAASLLLDLLVLLGLTAWFCRLRRPNLPKPPGPPGLPIIGNLFDAPQFPTADELHAWFSSFKDSYGVYISLWSLHTVSNSYHPDPKLGRAS